jgi:addiction module RelE/StbE family toxin
MTKLNEYTVLYLPIANKDLDEIISHIQTDSFNAALNFIETVDYQVSQLETFPLMGKIPEDKFLKEKGYRILIIGNYLVFYVVLEDKKIVEIRRILHGTSKYKFLL